MSTFCVGLKSTTFHSSIDQLWVTDSGGVPDNDAHPTQGQSVVDLLSTHQMIVQTPADPEAGLLHPRGLLEHLDLLKKATQVTVNVFDQYVYARYYITEHMC